MATSLKGKLDVDVEVKCKPEKMWSGLRDSVNLFPKAFPEQYKSIEILEGDGKAVGSVRLVTYAEGVPITKSKEKIEEVDEANKSASYSIIEGELMEFVKYFKCKVAVVPKDEGSLVKWSCEFEKTSEDVPEPDLIRVFAEKNFKDLDEYLLKN